MNESKNNRITIYFNLVLFIYFIIVTLADSFLLTPEMPKTPLDMIFETSPVLGIVLTLSILTVIIIGGSQLLKVFWNRFIIDVFNVRRITFQESLAVLLVSFFLIG
jgi:hypothetical protein